MNKNPYVVAVELIKETVPHNRYPYNLSVVRHLKKIELHPQVTFLIGENGTGKSTLLEAIACCFWLNPEWWSKNFNFSTEKTHSSLQDHIRLSCGTKKPRDAFFFRAESFYNLATNIDKLGGSLLWSYGGVSLHEQSHGESFFSLCNNRFFGHGFYYMDEPESALSPQGELSFLLRLNQLVTQQNSQFVIITHSPLLLSYPHAKIIEISEHWFEEVAYEETEHYKLYHSFLSNPSYMLDKLGIK